MKKIMNNEAEKINLIHSVYEDYLNISTSLYSHVNAKQEKTMDTKAKEILERREKMWASMKDYEALITSDVVNNLSEQTACFQG